MAFAHWCEVRLLLAWRPILTARPRRRLDQASPHRVLINDRAQVGALPAITNLRWSRGRRAYACPMSALGVAANLASVRVIETLMLG